jgi:hypothetical protein
MLRQEAYFAPRSLPSFTPKPLQGQIQRLDG